MTDTTMAMVIFLLVMALIITEKVHRAIAAVLGALLLMVCGIMDVKSAAGYIDFNTIGVLVGMMMFVSVVKHSGLFEYLAIRSAKAAGGDPWRIMVVFIVITAMLSSVLDNVTTVLLMGPVTIAVARILRTDPVPFLITQIMASNIGGTATLIGDPPNIMIGSAAGFTFMDFIVKNGPVITAVLAVSVICFRSIYGRRLAADSRAVKILMDMDENRMVTDRPLMIRCIVMTVVMVLGFVFHNAMGVETSVIALASAVAMLLVGRQSPEKILPELEWTTIIFFVGLFIVVGGLVETGIIDRLAELLTELMKGDTMTAAIVVLWGSAILSSTLDNIPFVATMIPLIGSMGESGMDITPLWWALSLGACLGGNGTLIGASANVVMAGIGEKNGASISYMSFLKVGCPLMLVSVMICTIYLVCTV